MNYTKSGDGDCKKDTYHPGQANLPYTLSDPRDPRYSTDKKRECMLRCLQARDEDPSGYSDLAFYVATEHYHISYKDRCQCVQAGESCEDWTDRNAATNKEDTNYMAYRIYDTRATPTLKPTTVPKAYPHMNYTQIGYGYCKNWVYLPGQSNLPYLLSDPRDPRYSTDKKRECMLRCLQARDEMPREYSDLGFSVATEHYHITYKDRCQCLKAGRSCEDYTERGHRTNDLDRNYMNYRIYDTLAAPTPKPTPAPKPFEANYMNYTMIGYGACKQSKYLPGLTYHMPGVLTDPRDPRYSTDKKRECMLRCLQAREDHPEEGYSPLAFYVATKERHISYVDRCHCVSGPCEDHTDRTHVTDGPDTNYIAYRIYDTRAPPTLKPTPAPKLYNYMNYSQIGYGQCKKYKYLVGQSYLPAFLSSTHDPLYNAEDRKRECMNRCLDAHEKSPNAYSNLAFTVATETGWGGRYQDRCHCVAGPCEDYTERTTNDNYMTYRIYDTRAAPTLKPTPAPKLYARMNYSLIGSGQCKQFKYLPGQNYVPGFLTDSRDPAYDAEDRKRECMNRCLTARDEYPAAGFSNVAFIVATEQWHASYADRCQCVKAGYSCDDFTARTDNDHYNTYSIYDTLAAPTLKPTSAPELYPHMHYEKIGRGRCKEFKYLPGQSYLPALLTDDRDPAYDKDDRKRECMLRCLKARDEHPEDGYSDLAFSLATAAWHSSYADRCQCAKGPCDTEDELQDTTSGHYDAYRIVNSYELTSQTGV
jgi:hypothetical protein